MMPESSISNRNWFALYIKPRNEFKAAELIRSVSIEIYLPTIIVKRKWSDRKKKVEVPLFSGYLFIYANEKERLLALQQNGVVRTITFLGKPSIIPEWQIVSLRKMLSETPDVFVSDKIEVGTQIKIIEGPFEGITGIVKEANSEKWLFVNIEILNRSVFVKLPRNFAAKNLEK